MRNSRSRTSLAGTVPSRDLVMKTTRHTFRFNVSGALTSQPIYGYDFLGLVAASTSATGATSVLSGVKLRRITLYSSGSNASSLGLVWAGAYAKPTMTSDTVLGTAEPAVFATAPPSGSAASFWISYAERATQYCAISAPTGTIIDVVADILWANGTVTSSAYVTYVSSGLVAGQLYFGPLDKQTGAPKIFPVTPVAYYG